MKEERDKVGIIKKLLLGPILGGDNRNKMPSYLRNMPDSYASPKSRFCSYHCIYCGKTITVSGTPTAKTGGSCRNSPYGSHFWKEK